MAEHLLVIDAGHSRIKFHAYGPGGVTRENKPLSPFIWPPQACFQEFKECVLIGTNQRHHVRLKAHLTTLGHSASELGKDLSVPIEGAITSTTGVDRLLNAYAAKEMFPGRPVLVVSAGTALVVDLIDQEGRFCGGSIGIGYGCYRQAMSGISEGLKVGEGPSKDYPAEDTSSAVFLGWFEPLKNTIHHLMSKHETEELVLTGGDGELVKSLLQKGTVHPHLAADALAKLLAYA